MELKPKKGINTDAHHIRQRWENDSPSRHACRNSSSHLENHKFESTTTEMSGCRFTQQQKTKTRKTTKCFCDKNDRPSSTQDTERLPQDVVCSYGPKTFSPPNTSPRAPQTLLFSHSCVYTRRWFPLEADLFVSSQKTNDDKI
jgi:hypothetical protein